MPRGLAYTAYILGLIGGIILIITAFIDFLSLGFTFNFGLGLDYFGPLFGDAFRVILGIVATIGARYVDYLGWAIGLTIIGLITLGSLGGILILVSGILGLVYRSTRPGR
jgi:hypothetical protein